MRRQNPGVGGSNNYFYIAVMQNENKIIASLTAQLEEKEARIFELQSQLEEALEVNQILQEPPVDFYHDD